MRAFASLLLVVAFHGLGIVADAETPEIPTPKPLQEALQNVEFPALNGSSIEDDQSLFGFNLFSRQTAGECASANGQRFSCTPNKCCNGEVTPGCCYEGQNCMTLNGNHACCPSDYQTCGMTMCTWPNSTCCVSTPGMACGANQICCGSGCCDAGRVCCGDEGCCESGYSCCKGSGSTKCCDNSFYQCCGGVCCPLDQDCCGDVCCDVGYTCRSRGECVLATTAVRTAVRTFTTTTTEAAAQSTDAAVGTAKLRDWGLTGLVLAAGLL